MQSFVIQGGRPLSGTIRASGNKNGALPILAATVLASEPVQLSNLPRIRDVEIMVELLADLGLKEACERQPALIGGINTMDGRLTHRAVAEAHGGLADLDSPGPPEVVFRLKLPAARLRATLADAPAE